MKLEDQVCSLELAKRLKELGVKQESLFYWRDYKSDAGIEVVFAPNAFHENAITIYEYCSAFTCSELGEMLPEKLIKDDIVNYYAIGKTNKNNKFYPEHEVSYNCEDDCIALTRDNTEANARAKMLIYLLENGLMKNE